jgi:hypothetical protein
MSPDENKPSPAIGLDIGTSRIVTARRANGEYEFQSQLNAFVNVPFSKMTVKALKKEGIPFATKDSEIVIYGSESEKFADVLGLETRRPMTAGILNPSETESAEVIWKIVDTLLGDGAGSGKLLYFSVPAAPLGSEEDLTYHKASVRDMLAEKGYKVSSINEGLAVIYGEMESSNYTGIGVSCGGGLCNVCLAYLSVPVLSFSIPKAGDFIDSSAASVTGDRATRVRIEKETSFQLNGAFTSKLHQALGVYYDDMIKAVVEGMREAFSSSLGLSKFDRPVPLVLSGGSALPKGFDKRFEKILRSGEFPVSVSEIRLAKDPLCTTAKGALAAALTEL